MSKGFRRQPPVALVVLDGWGYRAEREANAIELASTPVWHGLWNAAPAPSSTPRAWRRPPREPDGQQRGRPPEPRRGPGRPQDLVRITQSIQSGAFFQLDPLVALCQHLKSTGGTLHLMGLLGFGGCTLSTSTSSPPWNLASVTVCPGSRSTASSTGGMRPRCRAVK